MDALIAEGAVSVNGSPVTSLGVRVDPLHDRVLVEGRAVGLAERPVYILFNKPKDCITTVSDERGRTTVMDFVRVKQRIFPIGRLDRNTTGILLLTNDGLLAHSLLHPRFEIERMYRVTTARPVQDADLARLRKGVRLDDGIAKVRGAEIIEGSRRMKVLLAIGEGRNREVRRIFEAMDHDVRQLDRVSYAGLSPSGIARGAWRFLTKEEIRWLRELTALETTRLTRGRRRQG
jgi:pseudouridine synthase